MDIEKFVEEASKTQENIMADPDTQKIFNEIKQETMIMLNNLIDQATPKKPILEYYHFICPICSVGLDERCNYCPMCGQSIDRSEKDDN